LDRGDIVIDCENIVRNLRHMAWERAKGELRSMLHTFWSMDKDFKKLDDKVNSFIKEVEDEGLHE